MTTTEDTLPPGVLLDHATRTVEELDADTVALAERYGWTGGGEAAAVYDVTQRETVTDGTRGEAAALLREIAGEAVDYLNTRAPDGYGVWHDGEAGALVCVPLDRD